jgi:hypothetical protein
VITLQRNSDDDQPETATSKTTIIMMKIKNTQVLKASSQVPKGFSTPDTSFNASLDDSRSLDLVTPDVDDDFQAGDECYGTFGDMQDDDEKDEYCEEVLPDDFDSEDDGSDNYSDYTVDEEEYEMYLKGLKDHKIEDFNEWRASEHFPQHLFPKDDDFDEITIDSEEFDDCLSRGGIATDWTGKKLTLKTEKEKNEKKRREIKIKKKSRKHSSKSKSSSEAGTEKKSPRKHLISKEKSSKKVTTSRRSSSGTEDLQDKSSTKSPVSRRSSIGTKESPGKSSKRTSASRRSSVGTIDSQGKSRKKTSASRRSSTGTEDSQGKSPKKPHVSRRSSVGTKESLDKSSNKTSASRRSSIGTKDSQGKSSKKTSALRRSSIGTEDSQDKSRKKSPKSRRSSIGTKDSQDKSSKKTSASRRSSVGTEGSSGTRKRTSNRIRHNSLGALDKEKARQRLNGEKSEKSTSVGSRGARKSKSKDKSSRSVLEDGTAKPERASSMGRLGDARIRVSNIAESPFSPATLSTELSTTKNMAMSMRDVSTFDPFGVAASKTSDDFDMFVSDRNLVKAVKPQSTKSFASKVGSIKLQAMLAKSPGRKKGRGPTSMEHSTGTLPTVESGGVCW